MGRLGDLLRGAFKLPAASLGDPKQDVAGVLRDRCFLCSHLVADLTSDDCIYFGPSGELMPKLPAHVWCIEFKSIDALAREYNRRIHDLAGVSRTA